MERLVLELASRPPYDAAGLIAFLAARAVPGVEAVVDGGYRRTLSLPHGHAVATVEPRSPTGRALGIRIELTVEDERDVEAATTRLRRAFDLDTDGAIVDAALADDEVLAPLVAAVPGRRVPGSVDPFETAVRAVIGQQVSVRGARTLTGRVVTALGEPLRLDAGTSALTHVFPTPPAVSTADPTDRAVFSMPARRAASIVEVAARVVDGRVVLDPDADRAVVRAGLLAVPGVGPWTADYIAMRGLGDPDVFLPTDLGVRLGLATLGVPVARAERWRPWRSYAVHHLWSAAARRTSEVDGRPVGGSLP